MEWNYFLRGCSLGSNSSLLWKGLPDCDKALRRVCLSTSPRGWLGNRIIRLQERAVGIQVLGRAGCFVSLAEECGALTMEAAIRIAV